MSAIVVRPAGEDDVDWVVGTARAVLGSEYQVHLHRQFVVTDVDVLVAERAGERLGLLAWEATGEVCETLAIAAARRGEGVGRALMSALHGIAGDRGCGRLKVVTTDANVGAQRFYERLGYRVREVRPGAVDECRRRFKPEIPADMHDEIEYVREVSPGDR